MTFQPIGDLAGSVVEKLAAKRPGLVETHRITDRESWLAMRLADITASDVAAICGVDPDRSPLRVWAEKTGAIPQTADNATLRRGRWMEAAAVEALRETEPTWDIRRAGVYLRDPAIRIGATPDVVAIDPERAGFGIVQVKTTRRDIYERDWADEPPLKYQLQTLTEAMLAGADWAVLAALIIDGFGGAELRLHPVVRHEYAENRIRTAVSAFWSMVDAGRQPAMDYGKDSDVVEALYPYALRKEALDLAGDNRLPELLARRADLKAAIKAAADEVETIDTEVKEKLGVHELAELPGWRVSWKSQRRAEHVVKASEFRVLRVTDRRERDAA